MNPMKKRVLVTAPPMAHNVELFRSEAVELGFELIAPKVEQALTETELVTLLPTVDGWIIGDDPANRATLSAGTSGSLRAAVRWGIGMDNVDREAARELGLEIVNTPAVFGAEVADVALGYIIALGRSLFEIDRSVRRGGWPKTTGISFQEKKVLIVGYGDVGRSLNLRLRAIGMRVYASDPYAGRGQEASEPIWLEWGDSLHEMDFIVLSCPLTPETRGMINSSILKQLRPDVRLVNVSRGGLIVEEDLIAAKKQGNLGGIALDVFEEEPLPLNSELREFPDTIFGCHNGSNTIDAIVRASRIALKKMVEAFETYGASSTP